MCDYTITFARSARKKIENLNSALVYKIFPKIEALAKEPRPRGCRKLHERKICGVFESVIIG